MKRISANLSFIIGILGIFSAISYIFVLLSTGYSCFIPDNIIKTVYVIFIRIFWVITPYVGIVLSFFPGNMKKRTIGFSLNVLSIVLYCFLILMSSPNC